MLTAAAAAQPQKQRRVGRTDTASGGSSGRRFHGAEQPGGSAGSRKPANGSSPAGCSAAHQALPAAAAAAAAGSCSAACARPYGRCSSLLLLLIVLQPLSFRGCCVCKFESAFAAPYTQVASICIRRHRRTALVGCCWHWRRSWKQRAACCDAGHTGQRRPRRAPRGGKNHSWCGQVQGRFAFTKQLACAEARCTVVTTSDDVRAEMA